MAYACLKCPISIAAEESMKRTWTIIGVADVPQSFKWYQSLLGLPETVPAHDYFGQILDSDGTVLLCLHEWGAHEHPSLTSPHYAKPGNGLLLFFRVDNFDVALPRARALVSRLEEEPHVNPSSGTMEFSLRDPDGYYVTISALALCQFRPHAVQQTERYSITSVARASSVGGTAICIARAVRRLSARVVGLGTADQQPRHLC